MAERKMALMFTGQGSQRVGMWNDLRQSPAASKIFQMTDEIVRFPLSKVCSEGPIELLTETRNAQPAIIAHSLASWAAASEIHSELLELPQYCLGHSVGELAALVAAGVIDQRTGISLAHIRGLLMEQFGGKGVMAAVFQGGEEVEAMCKGTGAEAVNFNGPAQTVISGEAEGVEQVIKLAKRAKMLTVSHAFHHSLLMKPAQEKFAKILEYIEFRDAVVPIILNVTGRPSKSGKEIKENLMVQMNSPVRWHESVVSVLDQGANVFLEFGSEAILTGLLKRIAPEALGVCIKDYESAQKLSF